MRTFVQKPKAAQQITSAKLSRPVRARFGQSSEVNPILHLQRTKGNHAVERLLQNNAEKRNDVLASATSLHFGHDFSQIPVGPSAAGAIHTKLAINTPGDAYEREADRVADQLMRIPEQKLKRSCVCGGGCPECKAEQPNQERERLQTKRVGASDTEQAAAPPIVHEVLRSPGQPLDPATRAFFEPRFGHNFGDVRVHTDAKAAVSARAVNALAYTVGRNVVFGEGQFDARSDSGQRVLAHELAHTIQQRDATMPALERLVVPTPGDFYERQAEEIADSVMQPQDRRSANDGEENQGPGARRAAGDLRVARLQRVISFTTAVGAFTTNNPVANEVAADFNVGSPVPTFQWVPDVTIHGDPADPADVFTDWEVAHHQVVKSDWFNVWWGTGANRTHRHETVPGGLPLRDATAAGNTWYSDWRAQGFAANGDVRSPVMRDTPNSGAIPWANPIAGRGGTRGWFNYGMGFVSTLSARHIPDGTGAAAFRHLNHVHWNFSADGTFDTTLPVGGRVTLSSVAVNRSPMIAGVDVDNRPMHGTPLFIDTFVQTDT